MITQFKFYAKGTKVYYQLDPAGEPDPENDAVAADCMNQGIAGDVVEFLNRTRNQKPPQLPPPLTPAEAAVLTVLLDHKFQRLQSDLQDYIHLASWHLQAATGIELEAVGVPGDPALKTLIERGLIEEVEGLGGRYRVRVEG